MRTQNIEVTLIKNQRAQEEVIPINHLSILSIQEVWDYVETPNGNKKRQFLGTHIGSRLHGGWLVRETEREIERRIEHVATRCYLKVCSKSCCPK